MDSLGRVMVIGGDVDDDGMSATKEANAKDFVLLEVMNFRLYSWRMKIYLEA